MELTASRERWGLFEPMAPERERSGTSCNAGPLCMSAHGGLIEILAPVHKGTGASLILWPPWTSARTPHGTHRLERALGPL